MTSNKAMNCEHIDLSHTSNSHNVTTIDNRVDNRIDNSSIINFFANNIFNPPPEPSNREILEWLSPQLNFYANQIDLLAKREPNTGQWFLQHERFTEWLHEDSDQVLFCQGIPGAGKSILASVAIDYLEKAFVDKQGTTVTYLFCNYKEQRQHTARNFFCSLLHQLAITRTTNESIAGTTDESSAKGQSADDLIRALYKKHIARSTRPSLTECFELLKLITVKFELTKVFIVIDALDEMMDVERDIFLAQMRALAGALKNIKILLMSRPVMDIVEQIQNTTTLFVEILATNDDMETYIRGQLKRRPKLARLVVKDPNLASDIITGIVEKAQGMFLLAEFHLQTVAMSNNIHEVHSSLRNLPNGIDATYDDVIARIESKASADSLILAKTVLMWITYSFRPLKVEELQHALAAQDANRDTSLNKDLYIWKEDMVSACASLVTIDEESGVIRLIHHTAQDYLRRRGPEFLGPESHSQAKIAHICTTYLSFNIFDHFWRDREYYSFLAYAAQNWGHHARKALVKHHTSSENTDSTLKPEEIMPQIVKFLRGKKIMIETLVVERFWRGSPRRWAYIALDASPLIAAARFGLHSIVRLFLDNGVNPNLSGSRKTALQLGIKGGYQDVVLVLLRKGANVNIVGPNNKTPLMVAVKYGNEHIVQLLLKAGADGNPQAPVRYKNHILQWMKESIAIRTPCNTAIYDNKASSHPDKHFMRLILERAEGHTGIIWDDKRPFIIKLLLRFIQLLLGGITAVDNDANTISSDDCKELMEGFIKEQLQIRGVPWHKVKIHLAEALKDPKVIPLAESLREHKISVDAEVYEKGMWLLKLVMTTLRRIGRFSTPVHIAAREGHEAVVRLLLANGVNINAQDSDGNTVLATAVRYGHEKLVKFLLKHGADINVGDNPGQLLGQAVALRNEGIVQLLLENGAHVNEVITPERSTVLHRAVKAGCAELTYQVLLEDLKLVGLLPEYNKRKRTQSNASISSDSVILLLLKSGADINALDKKGFSPLSLAAKFQDEGVVRLLLDKGAEINPAQSCRLALVEAAASGNCKLVTLLLGNGAEVNAVDINGNTALSEALKAGHEGAVKVLLEGGADVNVGKAILDVAASSGHEGVVRMLLENSAEVNAVNRASKAIIVAASSGHVGVVQMLLKHGVNVKDDTAIHDALEKAINKGHKGVVQLLLDNGASISNTTLTLFEAATNGYYDAVQLLLENRADIDVDAIGSSGNTALSAAVGKGHEGVVSLLLRKGADVNAVEVSQVHRMDDNTRLRFFFGEGANAQAIRRRDGMSAVGGLYCLVRRLLKVAELLNFISNAEAYGYVAKELLLLLARYKVDRPKTPLYAAALNGQENIARVLLEHGANTNAVNYYGDTALSAAVAGGHEPIVCLLLQHGAMPNADALVQASKSGQQGVAKLLLEHGVNVNYIDKDGRTAIFTASARGYDGIVLLLLEHGADVNVAEEANGWTPLAVAARHGHVGVVQLLLDHGADTSAVDRHGNTALCTATARSIEDWVMNGAIFEHVRMFFDDITAWEKGGSYEQVIRLLLERGVDINAPDRRGNTALSWMAARGHEPIVQLLLKNGGDINAGEGSEVTALIQAAKRGNASMVRLLLANGANPKGATSDGLTPLRAAQEHGHAHTAALLKEHLNETALEALRRRIANVAGRRGMIVRFANHQKRAVARLPARICLLILKAIMAVLWRYKSFSVALLLKLSSFVLTVLGGRTAALKTQDSS